MFPFHGIQTLDFAQMSAHSDLDDAYMHNFELRAIAISTRPICSPAARLVGIDRHPLSSAGHRRVRSLNEKGDPVQHGFHPVILFRSGAGKIPTSAAEDLGRSYRLSRTRGEFALIEYDHVLPRAKLFAHWETPADGAGHAGQTCVSHRFRARTNRPALPYQHSAPASGRPNGRCRLRRNHRLPCQGHQLRAAAKLPAILLLNDRIHPELERFGGPPAGHYAALQLHHARSLSDPRQSHG